MIPPPCPWRAAARRLLAGPLYRLREFLGGLARGLRDRLAGAAGEAVAAVLQALLENPELPYRPRVRAYPEWEEHSWREEEESRWDEAPEDYDPPEPAEVAEGRSARWRAMLAAALHALAWWLRRPSARLPARAALAAGLAAGLAVAAGVPLAAVAALGGSALGLIALADAARAGADVLAAAANR